jgi:hypothetical protein
MRRKSFPPKGDTPLELPDWRGGDNLSVFWVGAPLFGAPLRVVSHKIMDLSLLLPEISMATDTQTLIRCEESKALG